MSESIDACIEQVCRKGCAAVRADIAALERGEELVETRHLSAAARVRLLRELKAIMAVYGDACPAERGVTQARG